jgi:hypothetical protein
MGAPFGAPRFELADIVTTHRSALESRTCLTREQRRVLTDIAQCRTAVLGGHLDVCDDCGHERPSYNSCRNRHCPKCQGLAQDRWIEKQQARLVDAAHFHVVFTLPEELRPLAAFAPRLVYALLFSCVSATLRDFGRSRLRARLGVTLVLHTWTKELLFHPHIHAVVTGGGLRDDGTWASSHQGFLFPVKAMSRVFRGKMRHALREAYEAGKFSGFDDFDDPEGFSRLSQRVAKKNWYVYSKRSFERAKHVVEYLGRYTHRVALSNSRIVAVSRDGVVIRTRGAGRAAMTGPELLRRFVQHVLPSGFHKIRHSGVYASPSARERITKPLLPNSARSLDYRERLLQVTGRDISRCPCCGGFLMPRPFPSARAPP